MREMRPDSILYALAEHTADRDAAARWVELLAAKEAAGGDDWNTEEARRQMVERQSIERTLRADLTARLQAGELIATGVWSGDKSRELVPKDWWAGDGWGYDKPYRKLDIAEDIARNFGGEVHELQIFRSNDPRLKNAAKARTAEPSRDKGGPTPKYDRLEIAREVIRYTGTDKPRTQRSLRRHLSDWAATRWETPPDPKTISAWARDLCPDWPPQ